MPNSTPADQKTSMVMLKFSLLIFCLLGVVNLMSFWLWSEGRISTHENGVLEMGQDIFLLLACLLYSYQSYKSLAKTQERYLACGMALLCFALFLREVEIDNLGASSLWKTLETALRSLTLASILVYIGLASTRMERNPTRLWGLLKSPTIILTLLGCIIYCLGWPFDKMVFAVPEALSVWMEETLELNATIIFLLAALIIHKA